ncbi:MAG: ATP-binding protein [Cyanobacteria bacterium SBLK]|nr:ATP-binding protein [Cyanobacteria bacterium SBLK]
MTNENRLALGEAIQALRSRMVWMLEDNDAPELENGEPEPLQPLQLPPALEYLGNCFGLSPLEQGVLLLCAAMEIDAAMPELCDRLQGGRNMSYPTFALAFDIFAEPSWDAMSSERPLRYWRLLEIAVRDSLPMMSSPLKIDDRILNFLTGSNFIDRRLASLLFPLGITGKGKKLSALSPSQQETVKEIRSVLERADAGRSLPIIQLLGGNTACKQQIAAEVATSYGRSLYGLMGELIPASNAEYTEFLRLWQREEYLLVLVLYIDTQEVMVEGSRGASLRRFLSQNGGLIFLDSREVKIPPNRDAVAIEVGFPTPKEQRGAWERLLASKAGDSPLRLAGQFNLNFGEIEKIAASAGDREEEERARVLWRHCLQRTLPRLDSLAQRLEVKASWENLVLPEEEMGLLWQIVHQARLRSRVYDDWGFRDRLNRGLGTAALFAGESGTGKTMAAEVIANELDLHLYRIDLSSVVSKYIGETEKNLRRLFDAAEEGGAILFFDEADSLFGKRGEVKDSHDRYANIEINYLLQRIEAYRGMAILATNLKASLDTAFIRRLRFIIDFPFPSEQYRQQLWKKVFPSALPVGDLDYVYLGRMNLTGGTIYNIAINAAFMAAEQGDVLEMEHILAAVRSEYLKLGRPIYESEFHWDGKVAAEDVYAFPEAINSQGRRSFQ